MEVLDFTIKELENEMEQQDLNMDDNQANLEIANCQAVKDFDFMLDSPSVKNLKRILNQKRFLLERHDLLPRIRDTINNLEF